MRWGVLAVPVILLALTAAALTVALGDWSRDTLLGALIVMCVLVAAIVVGATAMVWFRLLRPFRALRAAMDSVTAGDYVTQIPQVGPAELADLGRGIELMRKRLVKTLTARERAEERFRGLFDGAPDSMIAVAPDGSIAMANERAAQMFGYPARELVGQPVEVLVPEGWRDLLREPRGAHVADPGARPGTEEFRLTGLRRDGSEFPAEVMLSGLPAGRGMLVTATIRDFSERVALEAERERLRAAAQQERVERRMWQFQRLESLGQVQMAAQQAIRVTRQLQTFAGHEAATPEIIDLNQAVESAGQLPATAERAGPDAASPVPAPAGPAGDDADGHGNTILLVQDEPVLRELTSRILTRHGYQVCVAADGPDAVRRAKDPAQRLDLLLTNLVMPEMLGHELAARVAALRPQAPVLFISGHAQPIPDSRGARSPHCDILDKPFTEAALLSRVRKALARTPASTEPYRS